jgi:hypothetical protein
MSEQATVISEVFSPEEMAGAKALGWQLGGELQEVRPAGASPGFGVLT